MSGKTEGKLNSLKCNSEYEWKGDGGKDSRRSASGLEHWSPTALGVGTHVEDSDGIRNL